MAITEAEYFRIREELLSDYEESILALEERYMEFLTGVVVKAAPNIFKDFDQVIELLPFWANYPPEQRGRKPTGESIPWGEMGEKVISGSLLKALVEAYPDVEFPGLPLGSDIRFATKDAIIHLDLKITGPNDNPDEVVSSPHQVSGDGDGWSGDGMLNSRIEITGQRATMLFQPTLPPFYVLEGTVRVCLTYYLKAVYTVESLGRQPLAFMELACVPNGLVTFDGPMYCQTPLLFIPGKDDKTTAITKRRTRIRLDPLANIASWRTQKIVASEGVVTTKQRVMESLATTRQQRKLIK